MKSVRPITDAACRELFARAGERFSRTTIARLEEESAECKGNVQCLYPGCAVRFPRFALEAHHILPRHLGGKDEPRNGLILCRNHHEMADRCWILPDELREFKKLKRGEDYPWTYIHDHTIDRLLDAFNTALEDRSESLEERLKKRIPILHALRTKGESVSIESQKTKIEELMAYLIADRAAALTAALRPVPNERAIVLWLADEARSAARRLRLSGLEVHALHIKAVTHGSLGDFDLSLKTFENAQQLVDRKSCVPQDYECYLSCQYGTTSAKAGRFAQALEYWQKAAELAHDLGGGRMTECYLRGAEIHLLTLNIQEADKLWELGLAGLPSEKGVVPALAWRLQAVSAALRGDSGGTDYALTRALHLARKESLGHQVSKLESLSRLLTGRRFRRAVQGNGRRRPLTAFLSSREISTL